MYYSNIKKLLYFILNFYSTLHYLKVCFYLPNLLIFSFLLGISNLHAECLLNDGFDTMNPSIWTYPTGNSSYYGRTQIRPYLPSVSNGLLHLQLDTYNPSSTPNNPSFFGSEIITQHKFGPSITVEFRAQLLTPVNGLVGGLFLYEFFPTNLHSEIDFELLSNFHNQVQTNIYDDKPLGPGSPELHALSTDITQFNIYRIEWSSSKVNWFVNNVLVREYTTNVPQENLALHLNFHVPACDWVIACDPNLQPALSAQDNKVYFFNIDWVRVCSGIQSETISVLQKASILQILNNLITE